MEIFLLLISLVTTVFFLIRWYMFVLSSKSLRPFAGTKTAMSALPVLCAAVIITTLTRFASFDVVDSAFYIILYTLIGLSWLYFGLVLVSLLFDLSWIDDVLNLKNKAALFAVLGCALSVTLIYSGANIGDGPGWWCVFFAGGIGILIWLLVLLVLNRTVNMSERITIERDASFGLRLFFFLVAAGIIIGRASAGDWNSFGQTILDFKDVWPVLPLSAVFILTERLYINIGKNSKNAAENHFLSSVALGLVFVVFAVLCLIYILPLLFNLRYDNMQAVRGGAL